MLPKIPEGVGNAIDTTTKAAKEFLGNPTAQYEAGEVVFITAGSSAGTYLCIQKPPVGTPPYFGGGYFISFPSNPNGGVWM
jgi:hypothetical protein